MIDSKTQERIRKIVQDYCLMDDEFFNVCMENNPECVQLILRIILDKPDLKVIETQSQVFIANLLKRTVRLDVLAADSSGTKYNIEIQRADNGAGQKRARYHSSMLDARLTAKGTDFNDLPETYVIFITEHDVMQQNLPLYTIDRYIKENGAIFGDETHIIYVNGAYRSDTPLGRLMHDFACTQTAEMFYPELAARVDFIKDDEREGSFMSRKLEELLKERDKERDKAAKKDFARRLLTNGKLSLEEIADCSGLTLEEIQELQKSA